MESLKNILEEAGLNIKDFGKEYRCASTFRGGNNSTSLCIYKDTGKWFDFVTGENGTLSDLLKLLKKEINFDQNEIFINKKEHLIKQPKIYDPIILYKLQKNHSYWLNRGISEQVMNEFEGGISRGGKANNYYIFPVFSPNKKHLVGFSGRFLGKEYEGYKKWKHFSSILDRLYPLWLNEKDILEKKEVILVESIGNALSLFECGIRNVLVLFGTKINQTIISFLLKYNIQKIILLLDNDKNNNLIGNLASQKIEDKLYKHFDKYQIVNLTNELPFKDINEFLINDKEKLIEFCKKI